MWFLSRNPAVGRRFAILFTDVVNSYLSDAQIAATEGPMLHKFFGTLQWLGCNAAPNSWI